MALSKEDLLAISQMLDAKLSNMATKDDIADMATKDDIQRLNAKIDKLETDMLNTCLGYTDDQNETIITKLDNIQSTVNTAAKLKTIDNDLYNLINKRIDEVVERVERLERVS